MTQCCVLIGLSMAAESRSVLMLMAAGSVLLLMAAGSRCVLMVAVPPPIFINTAGRAQVLPAGVAHLASSRNGESYLRSGWRINAVGRAQILPVGLAHL